MVRGKFSPSDRMALIFEVVVGGEEAAMALRLAEFDS